MKKVPYNHSTKNESNFSEIDLEYIIYILYSSALLIVKDRVTKSLFNPKNKTEDFKRVFRVSINPQNMEFKDTSLFSR